MSCSQRLPPYESTAERGEVDTEEGRCDLINLPKITPRALGKILIEKCGPEYKWPHNTQQQRSSRRFLQAAIDYIPKAAINDGADLSDASFTFKDSMEDLIIMSGQGQWHFEFKNNGVGFDVTCTEKPKSYLSSLFLSSAALITGCVATVTSTCGITTQELWECADDLFEVVNSG